MASVEDTEVFIPEQARVITVPIHSLPSSITRKILAFPLLSNQPATFISPVQLRKKGTTHNPRPLTPGQFFLPVVTTNHKAFRILRTFLHSGENTLQLSEENTRAGSVFSRRMNSMVLFDTQIFLIIRKAKANDGSQDQQNHAPSECEPPPLNQTLSPMDDDITDRKCMMDAAAGDHGQCVDVLIKREADVLKDVAEMEPEVLMKHASTNTPSRVKLEKCSFSTCGCEAQSSLANAEGRKGGESQIVPRLMKNSNAELRSEREYANEAQTGNEKSSLDYLKTKISDSKSLLAKAECCKWLIFPSVMNMECEVKGQIGEVTPDQTIVSVSAAEITDIKEREEISQNITEDVTSSESCISVDASKGQCSLCKSSSEIVELNNDDSENGGVTVICQVEGLLENGKNLKHSVDDSVASDVVIMETYDYSNELATDENWESVSTGSDANVDGVNRHVNGDKRRVNETDAEDESEEPGQNCASSLADVEHCEKADRIVNDDNDAAASKRGTDVKSKVSSSMPVQRCGSLVEIVDLNDDDVIINTTIYGHRVSDVDKGCKRRLFSGSKDEINSSIEAGTRTDDDTISLAKRWKHHDDNVNVSPENKHLECDRNPNFDCDVEIIEVGGDDDDDDDDVIFSPECKHVEKAVESQVKNSNHDVMIIDANDGGGGDEDEVMNKERSSEAHVKESECLLMKSDVEMAEAAVLHNDQVCHESTSAPNRDDRNPNPEVNMTRTEELPAEGVIREVQRTSDETEIWRGEAEVVDVQDAGRDTLRHQIVVERDINEVQKESAAALLNANDKRGQASDEQNSAGSCSHEPDLDVMAGEASGCDPHHDDDHLASPSLTIQLEPSCDGPQNLDALMGSSEGRESDVESRTFHPAPHLELTDAQSEATNPVGVLPLLMSLREKEEFEYKVLRREENISRIRSRIRGIENKLKDLIKSHSNQYPH